MPFPPEDKSFEGLLRDILVRLGLIEGRLARRSDTSSSAAAPSWAPARLGQMHIRTDTHKVYIATGTATAADWTLVN